MQGMSGNELIREEHAEIEHLLGKRSGHFRKILAGFSDSCGLIQ